jgi:hypothetical protein
LEKKGRERVPKIESLHGYVECIEGVCTSWGSLDATTRPWFRGHADARWPLEPGIYRSGDDSQWEREMVRDFKLRAFPYPSPSPSSTLEWLFIMQHHGMPTRLLDWSEKYLVGLYFAVLDLTNTADACVWILDAWSLNEIAINQRTVPTVEYPKLRDYVLNPNPMQVERRVAARLPVAVRPPRATSRIQAQSGMFTIHGSDKRGLDRIASAVNSSKCKVRLTQVLIDGQYKEAIFGELMRAGVGAYGLFPDLDGLSRELRYQYLWAGAQGRDAERRR